MDLSCSRWTICHAARMIRRVANHAGPTAPSRKCAEASRVSTRLEQRLSLRRVQRAVVPDRPRQSDDSLREIARCQRHRARNHRGHDAVARDFSDPRGQPHQPCRLSQVCARGLEFARRVYFSHRSGAVGGRVAQPRQPPRVVAGVAVLLQSLARHFQLCLAAVDHRAGAGGTAWALPDAMPRCKTSRASPRS